jgi:hypothetical protein
MSGAAIGKFLWDRDLFIAIASLLLSLLLLQIYLRAVRRSMLRPAAGDETRRDVPQAADMPAEPPASPLETVEAQLPPARDVRAAWRGARRTAAVQLVAGLLYALTVTLAWGWLAQKQAVGQQMTLQGILLFTWYFAWPIVIVLGLVATISWRGIALIGLAYLAVLAGGTAWMMQGTPVTWGNVVSGWWGVNGVATILVLVILARPIRAMGPIVAVLTVAAAAGIFGTAHLLDAQMIEWVGTIAGNLGLSGRWGGIVASIFIFGVPALASALLGYLALRLLGRLYRARWFSDQSIQTDAVWLTFAVLQAPAQLPYLGLVAFPIYMLAAWLGHRLLLSRTAADSTAPRLLLLRVFSLGARSGRLFDAFSRLWRHRGSVNLIAGPDLANATVEPHEFLDFLAGRLQRRFITGPAVLEQRLVEAEQRRDSDGRFRVSSFYCHDDTWRMVLRRLARHSDLVLMDLRGFTPANAGCVYELNELLDTVRLERILLVVDGTTDRAFLSGVLKQGWASIGRGSINRDDPRPRVRLFPLPSSGGRGVDKLVATVAAMHRGGQPRQAA